MFPALPTSHKPNTLMAGLTRGTVRWDDPRSSAKTSAANPWGGGGGPAAGNATPAVAGGGVDPSPVARDGIDEASVGAGAGAGAGGKKAKKGKQVLYKFG